MGNSLKPCTNPPTNIELPVPLPITDIPLSLDIPLSPDFPLSPDVLLSFELPSSEQSINKISSLLDTIPKLNIDEIKDAQRKYQEQSKKDELYNNVPLTKDLLQQNIKNQNDFEYKLPASNLLSSDIYGFPILKINLLDYCLKNNKYITSIKINFIPKTSDIDKEVLTELLQYVCYNLTFDIYNLIFYGDFIQNQNLLLSNNLKNYIVLPEIIKKSYNNVNVNILNVNKLLPILDNLDIQLLVSEVELNEFAEGRINYNNCFEQHYERIDGTWNKLNICNSSGCTCVGYSLNIPKKE